MAVTAAQVAAERARIGLDPDPVSDKIWAERPWATLGDITPKLQTKLNEQLGNEMSGGGNPRPNNATDWLRIIGEIRAEIGALPDAVSDKVWVDRILAGTHTVDDARRVITERKAPGAPQGPPLKKPGEDEQVFDENAFAALTSLLQEFGLESLDGWLRSAIQAGKGRNQIMVELRTQDAYKRRFAGLIKRQQNGYNSITEAEYLQYETTARDLLRNANMPEGFWDGPEDFVDLIGNNVSINSVARRINDGYREVARAPAEIRDTFRSYFGINGDSALAAYFLDPTKSEDLLVRSVETAAAGGTALRFGLSIQKASAERIASMQFSKAQLESGYQQVSRQKPLFRETVSEKQDLSATNEGIGAAFGLDPNAEDRIMKRMESRVARFGGSSGGAVAAQTGVVGLGSTKKL